MFSRSQALPAFIAHFGTERDTSINSAYRFNFNMWLFRCYPLPATVNRIFGTVEVSFPRTDHLTLSQVTDTIQTTSTKIISLSYHMQRTQFRSQTLEDDYIGSVYRLHSDK